FLRHFRTDQQQRFLEHLFKPVALESRWARARKLNELLDEQVESADLGLNDLEIGYSHAASFGLLDHRVGENRQGVQWIAQLVRESCRQATERSELLSRPQTFAGLACTAKQLRVLDGDRRLLREQRHQSHLLRVEAPAQPGIQVEHADDAILGA